jgi:chemotaxis protein methyltransferase CheR
MKIYVIDDAMELCLDLRGWLGQDGHEVTCSPVGKTQLHTLLEYQPSLIVLGLTRHASEGMAFYTRLRNHRQLCQVPMIVVSDDAGLEYEMLDVFDFQVRPFDHERLNVCLKRLSGSHKYLADSFAEPELTALKSFLREHSGLHFSQHNHLILERGLLRRIQALRLKSLSTYLRYLTATPDNYDEVNKLLGLLTVGETSFFRYRSHREALLHFVLPRLIEENRTHGKLRIWSAGCSTGEEPYSLAILLREHFPELIDWDVQILATDINKRALRQAREGIYGERSLRMMEDSLRKCYFQETDGLFRLSGPIRRMVRFDYFNLQTDSFFAESKTIQGVDLMFCSNVLIYFELETIRRIVEKFSQVLSPKGFLFMGHAETMQNVSDRFLRHHQNNAFFYQCKEQAAAAKRLAVETSPLPGRTASNASSSPVPAQKKAAATAADSKRAVPLPTPKKPHDDPEQLYREAVSAFDHEKFTDAAKLFEALLELQPTNPKALVGKGLLLANQGQYSDARICCARALRVDDLLPEAYLLRGLILDMEGLLERALVEYQKVLWLDSAFVMAHYLAAKAYGRLADAEKHLRSLRNTIRALQQTDDQTIIPFSGGLSRGVFLAIAHSELAEVVIR